MFKKVVSTFCLSLCVPIAHAQDTIAQTLNITTHFKNVVDKPSWLLELRDVESGQVLPYLFDIRDNDNFFIAFSKERAYRVKASVLKFGPYATIKNFCHLEDGVLNGKSMFITLTGVLSPDPCQTKCRVNKFDQQQFIVVPPPVTVTTTTTTTVQPNTPPPPAPAPLLLQSTQQTIPSTPSSIPAPILQSTQTTPPTPSSAPTTLLQATQQTTPPIKPSDTTTVVQTKEPLPTS